MSKENGGPAFPIPLAPGSSYQGHGGEVDGMTLRDYFAAKAMAVVDGALGTGDFARQCYALADAMLAQSAK